MHYFEDVLLFRIEVEIDRRHDRLKQALPQILENRDEKGPAFKPGIGFPVEDEHTTQFTTIAVSRTAKCRTRAFFEDVPNGLKMSISIKNKDSHFFTARKQSHVAFVWQNVAFVMILLE